jgi:hypothetical protein
VRRPSSSRRRVACGRTSARRPIACVRLKPERPSRRLSRNCRIGAAAAIAEGSEDHQEKRETLTLPAEKARRGEGNGERAFGSLEAKASGVRDSVRFIPAECDARPISRVHPVLLFCRALRSPRINRGPAPRGNGAGVSRLRSPLIALASAGCTCRSVSSFVVRQRAACAPHIAAAADRIACARNLNGLRVGCRGTRASAPPPKSLKSLRANGEKAGAEAEMVSEHSVISTRRRSPPNS